MCMKPAKNEMASVRRGEDAADTPRFRKSLRNANINYRNGWFFVTFQVAHNKSIFGAIVGERCELNELGRQVEATSTARCDMPMKSGAAIFHPTAYLPRC